MSDIKTLLRNTGRHDSVERTFRAAYDDEGRVLLFNRSICMGGSYTPLIRATSEEYHVPHAKHYVIGWSTKPEPEAVWIDFLLNEGVLTEKALGLTEYMVVGGGGFDLRYISYEDGLATGREVAMVYQLLRAVTERSLITTDIEGFVKALDKCFDKGTAERKAFLLWLLSSSHSINTYATLGMLFSDNFIHQDFGFADDILSSMKGRGTHNCGWHTVPTQLSTEVYMLPHINHSYDFERLWSFRSRRSDVSYVHTCFLNALKEVDISLQLEKYNALVERLRKENEGKRKTTSD